MGRVQTGMASFCKPPPTAEQREQQHLEEGQKFQQQVQKQRADNQQRAAEAAKHKRKPGRPRKDAFGMHSILSKARTKQQENKRPDRKRKKTRSVARRQTRCNWWHPAVTIPFLERIPADVLAGRLAAAPAGQILPPQLEERERVGWDEKVGEAVAQNAVIQNARAVKGRMSGMTEKELAAVRTARRGVRRGAVKRGAERVHVPTVYLKLRRSGRVNFWRGGLKSSAPPPLSPHHSIGPIDV